MPVSLEEFRKIKNIYASLRAMKYTDKEVIIISANVVGIIGNGSSEKITYTVGVNLESFPDNLPDVFILDPDDSKIRHKNIYHPQRFFGNEKKPHICLGDLQTRVWPSLSKEHRTLIGLINTIHQILNNENDKDPAR